MAITVTILGIVKIGGWSKLQGLKPVNFVWCLVYLAKRGLSILGRGAQRETR